MPTPTITNVIAQLPFNAANAARWRESRDLSHIDIMAVHYNGPAMDWSKNPLDLLVQDANYHLAKDWNPPHQVHGWSLMYQYAIDWNGVIYKTAEEQYITWSVTDANPETISILCMIGQGQTPTQAMVRSLDALLDWLINERPDLPGLTDRSQVSGHGELTAYHNATDCPGPMLPFVREYRNAPPSPPSPSPANNRYFPETGQYISNAVKDAWESYEAVAAPAGGNMAMALIGYPISGEQVETVGEWTGTVQYFQRARAEWHTQSGQGAVMWGLLGADYLALLRKSGG